MIKSLLLINFLLWNFTVFGQTEINGGIVNGVWTKAESPYNIHAAILIANGDELKIEPGVSVVFHGSFKLMVLGRLLAIGTLSDSITFTASDSTVGWRGIRFENTPTTNLNSNFSYCKFIYGLATGGGFDDNGGALYFNNYSNVSISNCFIYKNKATDNGGGIYCYYSNPSISNNTISNNEAMADGAGIYCYESSPTISNNLIEFNVLTGSSTDGGAGIFLDQFSKANINKNIIAQNKALNSNGGGILCSDKSDATISNNVLFGNSARSGGGIELNFYSNAILLNNLIANNSSYSTMYGGGAIRCGYGVNATLLNNAIVNNAALNDGGGIYCSINSNPTIMYNTICNNIAKRGGALFCVSTCSPKIKSTIIWGNTAQVSGNQVFLEDEPSDPSIEYSIVEGGKANFGLEPNIFYTGTYANNLEVDPLMVLPSAGSGINYDGMNANWTLLSGSPCINTGFYSGNQPALDLAENPRIYAGNIDIGAYEFQGFVNSIIEKEAYISIFPNPANHFIDIEIRGTDIEEFEFSIFTMLGKEILKSSDNYYFYNGKGRISLNDLKPQIYLIEIVLNQRKHYRKISIFH